MAVITNTYDEIGLPLTTVTKTTSDTTGAVTYTAEVSISELAPTRSVTAEEQTSGIISLDPPTVSARATNALVRKAVTACGNSYAATEGFEFTGRILAHTSMVVSQSVLQALRGMGESV